jgi:hypothetical protein
MNSRPLVRHPAGIPLLTAVLFLAARVGEPLHLVIDEHEWGHEAPVSAPAPHDGEDHDRDPSHKPHPAADHDASLLMAPAKSAPKAPSPVTAPDPSPEPFQPAVLKFQRSSARAGPPAVLRSPSPPTRAPPQV